MMAVPYEEIKMTLLDAALIHVPFDGWSDATFHAASSDAGFEIGIARAVCPRGAVDLALAYHFQGDSLAINRMNSDEMPERFRDKVATGIRFRIEAISDKEVVRRATTLFALPMYASDGAKAVWGTADKIWNTLGDTSEDINWYTKRVTLSGVYSATVLYWLGDDSFDNQATWDFLDRRIEDVMRIEKIKSNFRKNAVLGKFFKSPKRLVDKIRAPMKSSNAGFPGSWGRDSN
jgi:ubiquinone biosynthesis protein COQ9